MSTTDLPTNSTPDRGSSATLPDSFSPPSRRSTAQQITLVDRTNPDRPEIQNPLQVRDDEDTLPESGSLSRRWTKQSLTGHAQSLQGSVLMTQTTLVPAMNSRAMPLLARSPEERTKMVVLWRPTLLIKDSAQF
ncbi:hypothetical protein KCU65_g335, partial [Aureobasidium melanogenum]